MLLEPGQRIGAYEILELLGTGGMGEVYRARDNRLGRLVAIKIVSESLRSDRAATERLEREARLASSLNHPAIVTVYDIGEVDGRPFIVMELIDGQSLSSRLATGPMTTRDAVNVACQVADGLAAAHEAGVVHRDLKPQNIMLTADLRAKVVDFGLSKSALAAPAPDDETATQHELTGAHTLLGSVGYMAPEQVSGPTVTFSADQFALGVVLYESLTGRRPFKRDTTIQTLAAIVEDEPTPILELCPSALPQLVTVLERCLAKHPAQRYASTRDLARDLRDVRDIVASSRRAMPSVLLPGRRRFRRAAAVMILALIVVGTVSFSLWTVTRRKDDAPIWFRQVAVLPFACGNAKPEDQVFCDGLVETLTSDLSELQRFDARLRVISQAVTLREMPSDRVSADNARRMLGATMSLTGGMQRSVSGIRVTLQRADVPAGRARSIDIPAGQEATLQSALVTTAAGLLDVDLVPDARAAIGEGSTNVPGASEAYVLGRGYLHRSVEDARNADRAVDALTRAVSADPRFAAAHLALCEAYWREFAQKRDEALVERAKASCRAANQIDDHLAPVYVAFAMIARGLPGRSEEAIQYASQAVALDPSNSDARHELGLSYEAAKQRDNAVAAYRAGLQARPDDSLLGNDLCRVYLVGEQWKDAEAQCRKAAALTPDSTRSLNNLGVALLKLQRSEEAYTKFRRSMEIRPTYQAASNLGYYLYDQGRYAEAAREYEKAARLNASNTEVWRSLGAALYWAPGERPKSTAAYERVIALAETARGANPRDPKLLGQLADAYSLLGRVREARATLEAVERLSPADNQVLFLVASVREQLGERAEALAALQRAIAAGYPRDLVDRSPFLAELQKDDRYVRLIAK